MASGLRCFVESLGYEKLVNTVVDADPNKMGDGSPIKVSIIIPTYNRTASLYKTLQSIHQQNYPQSCMELWVIDDGTDGNVEALLGPLREHMPIGYVKQRNSGATVARNNGASHATGELLIFADDDIEFMQDAILKLVQGVTGLNRSVVVGTLLASSQMESTGGSAVLTKTSAGNDLIPISVGKCFTGLLAIRREDFLALGMFQDPTGGWPNWDDVDFGYRAYLAGYELRRSQAAQAIHHDTSALNLAAASERWFRASYSAVRLFQKYPGLIKELPMFSDKTPIKLGQDPIRLIMRKLIRQFVSSGPIQTLLKWVESIKIFHRIAPNLIELVTRMILGGEVYMGLQSGIKDFGGFQE